MKKMKRETILPAALVLALFAGLFILERVLPPPPSLWC